MQSVEKCLIKNETKKYKPLTFVLFNGILNLERRIMIMATLKEKLEKMSPADRKKAMAEITNQGCGGKKPQKITGKKKASKK